MIIDDILISKSREFLDDIVLQLMAKEGIT